VAGHEVQLGEWSAGTATVHGMSPFIAAERIVAVVTRYDEPGMGGVCPQPNSRRCNAGGRSIS
jgi:hypothetical protein